MQLSSISLAITRLGFAWTPMQLFGSGEVGAWYDPSDFSTMFQDSAGTTPVTAAEQPVGLILDKSGRGNHASQATATKRPILKLVNGKYSLLFDGVDDALSTASIDFTGTDKMTVVAGVRKLSDAATGVPFEFSSAVSTNNGSFGGSVNGAGLTEKYSFGSRGTAAAYAGTTSAVYNSPNSSVYTGIGDISGDISRLRLNGVTITTTTTDQGTGNFGNHPLYIGSRAGTSLPFNGHLYQLVIRGAQSTDAQIVSAETYVNIKTGAWA